LTRDYLVDQLRDMGPHRALLRAVECKLMGREPLTPPVLDLGCGDGHFASVAYEELPLDVGIDVLARDLREAASRPGVYRHMVFASGACLPFPDASFNTVVSNCVLEHIPEVDTVLREISRVLRPGGVFLATMPSEHFGEYLLGTTLLRRLGLRRLSRGYSAFFNRISRHFHVLPPAAWKAKLELVGLHVEEQRYYFSPAAHRRFDLCHYLAVPNLISKRLVGRWVVWEAQAKLFARWLRPYYEEPLPAIGAYQFVRCRKGLG